MHPRHDHNEELWRELVDRNKAVVEGSEAQGLWPGRPCRLRMTWPIFDRRKTVIWMGKAICSEDVRILIRYRYT